MALHLQVAAAGVAHVSENAFSASQALTTLLTAESLLFAALNIGLAMATPTAGGRQITRKWAFGFALVAVIALTVVAAAGFLAWWEVFGSGWPTSNFRKTEALGIATGILVQPAISAALAYAIRPPRAGA